MTMTKQTFDATTEAVRQVLADGIVFKEVMNVLRECVFIPKNMIVMQAMSGRWHVRKDGVSLYDHVSYAACVEFALKYGETP
jgi:hypothetical protein